MQTPVEALFARRTSKVLVPVMSKELPKDAKVLAETTHTISVNSTAGTRPLPCQRATFRPQPHFA
eukprot:scaffold2695_cov239-Pinguiococcus_pyrenoidosus.AAC.2